MASPVRPYPSLADVASALGRFDPVVEGAADTAVVDLTQDSRRVRPGWLFAVRGGERTSGMDHLDDALRRGAAALMLEGSQAASAGAAARLRVSDVKAALGFAAEAVHGSPSRQLRLIGITGTNGKTTTASLVTQCLELLGQKTAQLGTLGFALDGTLTPLGLTTPEADAISRCLRQAVDAGALNLAMEVSSHSLVQQRVQALNFEVAAFSNLSQDHLDFHASLEEYGEAKARLFLECSPNHTVVNADDAFGARLLERVPGGLAVGTAEHCALRFVAERCSGKLRALRFEAEGRAFELETGLYGAHNVENWLLCLGILSVLGADLDDVLEIAPRVRAAPGRFERCDTEADDVVVVVDYAHTPDALARALAAARELVRGRLLCVFGCGGDRDERKRPLMGEVVGKAADQSIVTNDNPRTEEPSRIAHAIERGIAAVAAVGTYELILNRREAIEHAIVGAAPGDVVLIAGKGHEDYQIMGERRLHFDDREEAQRALLLRRGSRKE